MLADANAPAASSWHLRGFRGPDDFPAMAAVLTASEGADGLERQVTAEGLAAARLGPP